MSNTVHTRHRGKPGNQEHNNVINSHHQPAYGPQQGQFVVPRVATNEFRADFSAPPQLPAFAPQYPYEPNGPPRNSYYPAQPPGYNRDYNGTHFNPSFTPVPPQQQFYPEGSTYQNYQPQQPAPPVAPPRPREKKILSFVDPVSNKTIDLPKATPTSSGATTGTTPGSNSTASATPVSATTDSAKKNQTKNEFLDKVKNQLSNKQDAPKVDATPAAVTETPKEEKQPEATPVVVSKEASPPVVSKEATPPVVPKDAEPVVVPKEPESPVVVKENTPEVVRPVVEQVQPQTVEQPIEIEEKKEATPTVIEEVVTPATVTPTTTIEESLPEVVKKTPEELAQELAEKEAAELEKRRQREEELDKKVAEYLVTDAEPSKGVYGRDFMTTLRDLVKEYNRAPCPLSPSELAGFGLDIKTMKKLEGGKTFQPTWAQNKPRGNSSYRGRTTTDGTGRSGPRPDRGMHKKPPVIRGSIERVQKFTLPTSKDAWKPDRQKGTSDIPEDQAKAKVQEVCKKVRSLMNKITPTSKDQLINEFIAYKVSSNEEQLAKVVNIIFDKAVEEPKFCSLYAEVCKAQVDHELKSNSENASKSLFRNAVLTRTQTTFYDRTLEIGEEKLKAAEAETDAVKKQEVLAGVLEEKLKFRRRKFGNMTFIGHLYRNQLLSTKIVHSCIFDLLKSIVPAADAPLKNGDVDEESVHCALQLMETLGSILDNSKAKDCSSVFLDQWFTKLEAAKPVCTNKIRFMIMNLIELRKSHWIPRKSVETGPKKIDEIHRDIRQEQIEKEKQREQYDRKQGSGIRPNSNSMKKQLPVGRGSIERKNLNPEHKRAAAAATTKLTTSTVQPKNLTLSQMNDTGLGPVKNKWQSGSSGGGSTTSSAQPEPSKNAWGRRDSNDQRKKSTADHSQTSQNSGSQAQKIGSKRSTSQNSNEAVVEEVIDEERKLALQKIMNMVKSSLEEIASGDLKNEEFLEDLFKLVGVEKYGKPSLPLVYSMAVRSAPDRGLKDDARKTLARLLRESLTDKKIKQDFIDGVVRFVKEVVDKEEWEDTPMIWSYTGELLVNASHQPELPEDASIEMLSIKDFEPIFLAAKTDVPGKKFVLLVEFLKKLAQTELSQGNDTADVVSWEYQELSMRKELENEGLLEELSKCEMGVGKTLKNVLKI